MPRPKSANPKITKHIPIDPDLCAKAELQLFSDLEGRVPYKANSDFITQLLRDHFAARQIDLAPWTGSTPGAMILTGSEAAVESLRLLLTKESSHG